MELHVLLSALVAIAAFSGLIAATATSDQVRQQRLCAWVRRLMLGYGVLALVLALLHWWRYPDWVHLFWTSTHPQIVLCVGAGAFLMRDEWRRRAGAARFGRGPWILLGTLLAFALLPALLIQWFPDPNAEPRNLGRPIAGTLEVACLGFGGPLAAALVPENEAGLVRGMGFLPREITVPVGALASFAVLWLVLCFVQLTGALLRPLGLRRGYFLLAPCGAFALLWWPMPFGLKGNTLWSTDPTLMRAFGPLLLAASLASLAVPWESVACPPQRSLADLKSFRRAA